MTLKHVQPLADKPRSAAATAAEALRVARAAADLSESNHKLLLENRQTLQELHDAWMKPHPGYGDKSLLDAVSHLVASAGAGKIVGERIVKGAALVSALSVIGAAFYAAVHWGAPKP